MLGIGAGVQLCMQSVSKLFGKYQGTAASALSGGFTLSAAVPLIIGDAISALAGAASYRDARLYVMLAGPHTSRRRPLFTRHSSSFHGVHFQPGT